MKKTIMLAVAGAALVVIAALGIILALSPSSNGDGRKFVLQRADLPAEDFSLTEEKDVSRQDILAQLPADAQIAEQSLVEALEVGYASAGEYPMIVRALVYTYPDEKAAEAAHRFHRNSDWLSLTPVVLNHAELGYAFRADDAGLLDDLGEDAFWMEDYVDRVEDYGGTDLSNSMNIYFMQSGSRRAEVLVFGSHIFVEPFRIARNQYLRLKHGDELTP